MYRGSKRDPDSREASRTSVRQLRRIAFAVSAAMTLVLAGSFNAFAEPSPPQAPPKTQEQHTFAIIKPSIVFIQTHWAAYLRHATFDGTDLGALLAHSQGLPSGAAPVISGVSDCSGFVANPDGYVVTAGHCVDDGTGPGGAHRDLINLALAQLEADHDLQPGSLAPLREHAYSNWEVTGQAVGTPPARSVEVIPTGASADAKPVKADVKGFRALDKGDVALLKISTATTGPLPALQVASGATPPDGTKVVAAGFPGSVAGIVDTNNTPELRSPSLKEGTISGKQTVAGAEYTEISAHITPGMSGGPVVNMQGQVLGVNSWGPTEQGAEHGFMTDTVTTREVVGGNNKLSPEDQAYRAGLEDYFANPCRCDDAAQKFSQVLHAKPNHAQALQFRNLAEAEAKASPQGGSNTLMWVLIGIGIFLFAALAAAGALLLRRRRHRGPTGAQREVPTPRQPAQPTQERAQAPTQDRATDSHTASERTGHFCPNCGTPHDAGAHFCASCGSCLPAPCCAWSRGSWPIEHL